LFDLAYSTPEKIKLTNAEVHDINFLDEMITEPGITYLYDRAYINYGKLDIQTLNGIYFVSRLKSNAVITVVETKETNGEDGVFEDKIVVLGNGKTKMKTKVRIVQVEDERTKRRFYLVTNRFDLTAEEISELYRLRWKIELFFKFIKGHMTVKHFYGNSYNAIKTQLFIVMTVYCLLISVKIENKMDCNLLELLRAMKNSPWGKFRNLFELFVKKENKKHNRNRRWKMDWKEEYNRILGTFEVYDEYQCWMAKVALLITLTDLRTIQILLNLLVS
jgi:hypothetical protein